VAKTRVPKGFNHVHNVQSTEQERKRPILLGLSNANNIKNVAQKPAALSHKYISFSDFVF